MARRKRLSSSSSSESDSDMSWLCSESSDSEEELCDYEKRRLDNIRRNQQMMRSLGEPLILATIIFIQHSEVVEPLLQT